MQIDSGTRVDSRNALKKSSCKTPALGVEPRPMLKIFKVFR